MKKLCTAIIFLLFTAPVFSQSIGGGFKIGANYTNITGNDVSENNFYDRKLGFHGGLVVDFGISRVVSVKSELLYSRKGFQYDNVEREGPGYRYSYEGKETYHCIDLPVLLNVKVGQVFLEAGPMFSFLVGRDREVRERRALLGTIEYIQSNSTQTEGFNFFDYGLAIGAGYQFQSRLNFGARYNASFRNLQEPDKMNYPFPADARNSVFQLSIGYMFYDSPKVD